MEAKKAFSEFIVSVMELECSPSASPKVSRMPDEVISEKENPFDRRQMDSLFSLAATSFSVVMSDLQEYIILMIIQSYHR